MKEYCKHGHRLIGNNLYIKPSGKIECKACSRRYIKKFELTHPWSIHFKLAKDRCQNKNSKDYRYYGKKGRMLLMTKKDFKFLWFRDNASSMKQPSIDRVDNDGNYELSNCRFLEKSENSSRAMTGENNHRSKLTEKDVIEIRRLYKNGVRQYVIAKKYEISPDVVYNIVHQLTWKHI